MRKYFTMDYNIIARPPVSRFSRKDIVKNRSGRGLHNIFKSMIKKLYLHRAI